MTVDVLNTLVELDFQGQEYVTEFELGATIRSATI